MLRQCRYDLSRLENLSGNLEQLTGKEMAGIFCLAKQNSGFIELWSSRPMECVEPEETLVVSAVSQHSLYPKDCTTSNDSLHTLSEEFGRQDLTRVASPIPKRSFSPPPLRNNAPFLPNPTVVRYYQLSFGGLHLPILAVGYLCKESKMICCYGGSRGGTRFFLSSRE